MRIRRKNLIRYSKQNIYLSFIFVLSILIGVGYSYLNSTLSISGTTTITKSTWDVHFENLIPTEGSVAATSTIENNSTLVNFEVALENPGDFYEFTIDVVNAGSIDAMIGSLVNTGLTEDQSRFLDYTVTYADGTLIKEKDLLKATTKDTVKVKVKYKDDITAADLPGEDQYLELQLNLIYVQADDSALAVAHTVCKRATSLHVSGDNTYGSLGNIGTLAGGDAFDCDVNGDGIYDSATERFYYITDLNTNNNYATLIYYSNVSSGMPNNTDHFPYNTVGSLRGPETAMKQLPTTTQWTNISLSNTTRDIINENGEVKVNNFSYEGYAARLITLQEVKKVCKGTDDYGNVTLDDCKYLLENIPAEGALIGYWLENYQGNSSYVYIVTRPNSILTAGSTWGGNGVRPVIEVPKTMMNY